MTKVSVKAVAEKIVLRCPSQTPKTLWLDTLVEVEAYVEAEAYPGPTIVSTSVGGVEVRR